jgi:serine/threonine protein kinase
LDINSLIIIRKLGNGKFSTTYLVRDMSRNKFVSKILKEPCSKIESNIDLNIKNVQCCYLQKDNILIKQYFEGVSFQFNRYSKLIGLKVCLELIDIIQRLHEKDIIHCDIKPSNVIYDRNNEDVNLIDLGLSVNCNENIKRSHRYSMIYSSPEVLLNSVECISKESDYFSLCIIIIEILTRRKAYNVSMPMEIINLMIAQEIKTPKCNLLLFDVLKKGTLKPEFGIPPNQTSKKERNNILNKNIKNRKFNIEDLKVGLTREIETIQNSLSNRLKEKFSYLKRNL